MSETSQDSKAQSGAETKAFEAETRQLLDIVIHSLYSNKEIFLRELISNASDALDRRRFEAVSDETLHEKGTILEIRLEADADTRTLSVSDSGIGMSREEVVTNIGTIAKSGTRQVLAQMKESKSAEAADLIGQFGVGFYSAFMVADRVELVTRRAGERDATRWESTGDGTYSIDTTTRFMPGTTITLHLKPVDQDAGLADFTEFYELQRIVKRYSDFVAYPIQLKHQVEKPVLDSEGKPEAKEGEAPKTETVIEDKTLNSMKPIWTRPKSEVEDEEYAEFYRHISHDWTPPLDTLSLSAEGRIEYQALLFLPSQPPMDMFYRDQSWGLQLYVRRVLIKERFEDLLPVYLRFIKGVVDSPDLPLNVSRELVQQDRHITQMRRWLTRKVLDHLGTMQAKDEEKYLGFWKSFGRVIKEGVSADADNREKILPLLRFPSSNDESKLTTLSDYVSRMKPDQEHIYYLTGDSRAVVESSPHLEALKSRGYEVLYLIDPVDELVTQALTEFEEKKLRSAAKGTVELGSDEEKKKAKEELEAKQKDFEGLLTSLAKPLDEWVKEVRLTQRLTESPACLVGTEHDMSPQLEKMLRQIEGGPEVGPQKRILELNPDHALIETLRGRQADSADENADDERLADDAYLLYGYALLAEGSELPDPARFSRLLANLMASQP